MHQGLFRFCVEASDGSSESCYDLDPTWDVSTRALVIFAFVHTVFAVGCYLSNNWKIGMMPCNLLSCTACLIAITVYVSNLNNETGFSVSWSWVLCLLAGVMGFANIWGSYKRETWVVFTMLTTLLLIIVSMATTEWASSSGSSSTISLGLFNSCRTIGNSTTCGDSFQWFLAVVAFVEMACYMCFLVVTGTVFPRLFLFVVPNFILTMIFTMAAMILYASKQDKTLGYSWVLCLLAALVSMLGVYFALEQASRTTVTVYRRM